MQKNNLKKLQNEILSIYKEIKKVCEKNNIKYFAVGGTALGAVRHQGFIPWDDDLDIGIPIDDFEKFKKACKKDLPAPYEFKELLWIGGKVHNKNTTLLETTWLMNEDSCYGIFVDIFPIIGAPNNTAAMWEFQNDMFRYHFKSMILDRYKEVSAFNLKDIQKWQKKILYKYPLWNSTRAVEFASGSWFSKSVKGMLQPIEMPFEDTTIPVPSSYNEDLTAQYGDYKTLPPLNQRKTHNEYAIIDFNKPYTFYLKKLKKIDHKLFSFLNKKHNLEGTFFDNSTNFALSNRHLEHQNQQLQQQVSKILNSRTYKLSKKISNLYSKLKF